MRGVYAPSRRPRPGWVLQLPHTGPSGPSIPRPVTGAVPAARTRRLAVRRRTWRTIGCRAALLSQILRAAQAALEHFAQAAVDGFTRSEYSRPDRADRAVHRGCNVFV